MKKAYIYILAIALGALAFSCEFEVEPTPTFEKSDAAVTVASSATTVAVSAADSLKEVVSLSWNDPGYAVGLTDTKFTVRIAESGSNFSSFVSKDFTGVLTGALLGRDLNGAAFKFGGKVGEPIALDVMVVATHSNNNEQKVSNVIQVTVTPFTDLGLVASESSILLSSTTESDTALIVNWTSAFKGFSAVKTYQLQYAKGGTDFASTEIEEIDTFARAFTHEALNDLALGYGIAPGTEGSIDFRIRSTNELGGEILSNTVTVTVTPYATSFLPLYGMGDALNGWGPWPEKAVELVSTEYKKYYGYMYLTQDKAFRFFDQLDWEPTSYNYPFFTSVADEFVNANDGDSNFKFIGTTGWYKVNVDLIAKTVTIEASAQPALYMTGAALNGWNWDNPIEMTYIKTGVFEATTNFNNEAFRFFAQPDWAPTAYNYPYFEIVDPNFENANDGDSNLKFIGTAGSHKITVDLVNGVVALDLPTSLYMTGEALNGWNWDNPVTMTQLSPGVFRATATFKSDQTFRFFAQPDWGPVAFNYPHFESVDSDFENGNDGDSNLRFIGDEGEYTITVNLLTKVVTLE